ncbi:MAG TPA: UDP-N-acetylmuramoyl-L-alanyl-D-glutamate--2,6-diaminopimelate ligase [Stellaceae bacterium]|nr:UDP-N-acetylmuramoyl-L-alanyl-D-glutamate--2,6-diaminopimelate ligase [Stellaceae bacterium]
MDGAQGPLIITPPGDPDIRGLTADSRTVKPGFLFAALAGSKLDGRRFVDDAIARGAVAVLTDDPAPLSTLAQQRPPVHVIFDPNPRRRLARIAARFYAPQPETMVAVTGTNGKTSVTVFTRQIWHHLGFRAASFGTIGIVGPDFAQPGSLTTPDPVSLHRELNVLARSGIDHVAIEASSHGLDQCRLDGLELGAAAFTNLTRDHLDYHRDMEAYFAAKARLFTELLPPDGTAVLNADSSEAARLGQLCRQRGQTVLTFGTAIGADLRLVAARPLDTGQELRLEVFGERRDLVLPLVGAFQASNALAALGLAIATGAPVERALDALPTLKGAPGRLQHVATHRNGAPVIVDYAHTPDALATVLGTLRAHCRGRLVVVFGCGGDRDPGKRSDMGAIAQRLADRVIVTDDNPRSEDPAAIRRAILARCPEAEEIGDRAHAISRGLALLEAGDLLLIAGKGHESGQIVAGITHPFDDAVIAREAAIALGGTAS